MTDQNSMAIVVASCDKYSDMWPVFFGQFFTHWPDCPYPIYLVANNKHFDEQRVTTLLAGEDVDWSTTILRCLEKIGHTHCLLLIDDAFLCEPVNTSEIKRLFNFVTDNQANFLRLRPNPKPSKTLNPEFGILDEKALYRVSVFSTIWNTHTLRKLLIPGESAWAFEKHGTERSRQMGGFFTVLKDIFTYLHGVERGVWIRPTAKKLERLGYQLDYRYRPCMSFYQNIGLHYRLLKSWILHKIPEKHRADVLKFVRICYRGMGLRKI